MTAPVPSGHPTNIGSYRVIARLASGGMAEIYLATRSGAAGFERAVAIKRMFPHLAAEPELRDSLLDEARLMSRLRHPNVVAVEELGTDGASFYLVMEYLRGDSLSGLLRRLRARHEGLDPSLAAYIVAEACAGLHVAHELQDEENKPMNVVHRDVSPQNVFVTFEGEVKVLDFGIARFSDRKSARTKTGITKGKFAYMAPEQFTCAPVDRRADIFASGALLYELLTGERLFARDSEMQVLKAILQDPIPRPSEHAPGVPSALDEVCLRALARDPDARFPTSEAMRISLRDLMPALDPGHHARERLVALMRRVLPDRWQETDDLMRRLRDTPGSKRSKPTPRPDEVETLAAPITPPAPITLDRESSDANIEVLVEEASTSADRPSRIAARARAGRVWMTLVATGLSISLGLGLFALLPPSRPVRATAPSRPGAQPEIEAPPPAPPEPLKMPEPLPARDVAAVPPPPIRVHVDTIPPAAEVSIGATPVCTTPCDFTLERGTAAVALTIARRGHATTTELLVPDADARVRVQLAALVSRRPDAGGFFAF